MEEKNIFCHKCSNFYKSDALKLLPLIILFGWNEILAIDHLVLKDGFDEIANNIEEASIAFVNKLDQEFIMHYEFYARIYFINFLLGIGE